MKRQKALRLFQDCSFMRYQKLNIIDDESKGYQCNLDYVLGLLRFEEEVKYCEETPDRDKRILRNDKR